MTSNPTPFERLLRLEQLVSDLVTQTSTPRLPAVHESSLPTRHLWPADELLLTRLIRRNPEALKAYEAPAELIQTKEQGVVLKAIAESSPFRFCELTSGDAAVWLAQEHESWLYTTDIFRSIFKAPIISDKQASLVLQSLPRFIRKVQGQEWTIERMGQMIPKTRPFVEQAEQAELEQRIQRLELTFARMSGGLDAELSALKSHVQILQDHLDRLLKLNANNPSS
jgi:uncharacterized coiled-coil protein SlyX